MLKRFRDLSVNGFLGAVFLVAGMSSASAVPFTGTLVKDGAYYVGSINDGIPSNAVSEVSYINILIGYAAGTGDTVNGTETYNRVNGIAGPFDAAVITDSFKDETANPTVDITGSIYQYILGKYDAKKAGSLVWYNADGFTGEMTLPSTFNTQGISHISGFNLDPDSTPFIPVPEPGVISLLGLGLLGLGLSRRRIRG